MKFDSFIADILATILGGAILTFLFFLIKEKIYKNINLNGKWHYKQETLASQYNPYLSMQLTYLALITCEGNNIYGTAEKIQEKKQCGEVTNYTGKERTLVEITGHIEKRYLSKDKICFHIKEFGKQRTSSSLYIVEANGKNSLDGKFYSTISNQEGSVKWERITI